MWKQWSNIRGFALYVSILLAVVLADSFFVFYYARIVTQFLENQPPLLHADAGIVFFGDDRDKGKHLGPVSIKRAELAADLYHAGKIDNVVCVGGYEFRKRHGEPHTMKNFLLQKGMPEHAILHDSLSFNTLTNIAEARKIIRLKRFRNVVVISSPFHVYRISKTFRGNDIQYRSYAFRPSSLSDYWFLFRDVHREWISRFLSIVLKDNVRNRIVYLYRSLRNRLEPVF